VAEHCEQPREGGEAEGITLAVNPFRLPNPGGQHSHALAAVLTARRRRAVERITTGGVASAEEWVLYFLVEASVTKMTKLAIRLGVTLPHRDCDG
jgi:hypothetical protein